MDRAPLPDAFGAAPVNRGRSIAAGMRQAKASGSSIATGAGAQRCGTGTPNDSIGSERRTRGLLLRSHAYLPSELPGAGGGRDRGCLRIGGGFTARQPRSRLRSRAIRSWCSKPIASAGVRQVVTAVSSSTASVGWTRFAGSTAMRLTICYGTCGGAATRLCASG